MRILHCIATMRDGGAERQLVYLVEAQVLKGHEVHVALLREGVNAARLHRTGATVHLIRHAGNYDPLVIFRLARLISRLRPVVVQSWLSQMDVLTGLAAALGGARWIATERSQADAYPTTMWTRLRTAVIRHARAIVANSEGGARYWRARAPRVPVTVVPNALPMDDVRGAVPAALDRRVGPVILYAGRLSAEKNVPTILRAMTLEPLRNASLILCGDGPLRASLHDLAQELGIADRVTFAGFVSPLSPLLKAVDAFVSASVFEGHPNAVLEALACECPLVVSDIPAHREFLSDASARFFDPRSPEEAAAALGQALSDRSGTAARVAAAREAIPTFDPRRVADLYDRVYASVAPTA